MLTVRGAGEARNAAVDISRVPPHTSIIDFKGFQMSTNNVQTTSAWYDENIKRWRTRDGKFCKAPVVEVAVAAEENALDAWLATVPDDIEFECDWNAVWVAACDAFLADLTAQVTADACATAHDHDRHVLDYLCDLAEAARDAYSTPYPYYHAA